MPCDDGYYYDKYCTTNVKPAEQACVEAVVRQNVNHVTGPVARNAHLSIFVGSLTNFNAINAMMDRSMIWLTAKSVGNAIASNVSLLNAMEWTAVIPARAVPAYSQKSSGGHQNIRRERYKSNARRTDWQVITSIIGFNSNDTLFTFKRYDPRLI